MIQTLRSWLRGRLHSFRYAFAGLWIVLGQRNTHIHLFIGSVVVLCGLLWQLNQAEWLAITITITLVLVLEAVNTAIEATVDLASPAMHPIAKRAKDVAASAVLLGAIGAALVALLVFGPRILALINWLFA